MSRSPWPNTSTGTTTGASMANSASTPRPRSSPPTRRQATIRPSSPPGPDDKAQRLHQTRGASTVRRILLHPIGFGVFGRIGGMGEHSVERLVELRRQIARLQALQVQELAAYSASRGDAADVASELALAFAVSENAVRNEVSLARDLVE